MGKNKKVKNNVATKNVKKETVETVKNEKNVKKEQNVQNKVQNENQKVLEKENKKKEKEAKKIAKKEEKVKAKENKKAEKLAKKEAKMEENLTEKALIKKAKKAQNNDTKVIIGMVIVVLLIAFGIFGFYFYKLNSECVATYDGGKVSVADYEVYYKTFSPMLEYYGYPASIIPEQIVNKAALDQIIIAMAKAEGVTVSDEDIASVEEVFNDKEQLASFTEQGIDIARMKKLYLNDYLITAYLEKLAKEAKDEDVIEYIKSMNSENENLDLNEYNTSHILFKTKNDNNEDLSADEKAAKKAKAEATLARVKNGEDFATVAKELSEDIGTKEEGGKYVMYDNGSTVEQYIAAVKTLKDGEIYATLVETEFGYHIIKLDSKVENGRAKSENEREEYVDYKVNSLAKEKNVQTNLEMLNKVIQRLTGKAIETEDETNESLENTTSTEETAGESDATEQTDSTASSDAAQVE